MVMQNATDGYQHTIYASHTSVLDVVDDERGQDGDVPSIPLPDLHDLLRPEHVVVGVGVGVAGVGGAMAVYGAAGVVVSANPPPKPMELNWQ